MRQEFLEKLDEFHRSPKTKADQIVSVLGERLIIELATSVAQGPAPEHVVFERAGVPPHLWSYVRESRLYQLHLEEQLQLANTPREVSKRIRDRARVMVEAALPVVYELATKDDNAPMARLEAFRTLAKLAGAEARETKGPDKPRAAITIDLS